MTSAHAAASEGVVDDEAVFFGFGAGGAAFRQADADVAAAVAQIQRVCVALRAVADDCDFFRLDKGEIRVLIVIELCHSTFLL